MAREQCSEVSKIFSVTLLRYHKTLKSMSQRLCLWQHFSCGISSSGRQAHWFEPIGDHSLKMYCDSLHEIFMCVYTDHAITPQRCIFTLSDNWELYSSRWPLSGEVLDAYIQQKMFQRSIFHNDNLYAVVIIHTDNCFLLDFLILLL